MINYDDINFDKIDEALDASPSRMVVMLYDELIESLQDTVTAIERGDIEARYLANTRAADIVCHLFLALDMERGGAIAERLAAIYRYILAELPAVNMDNDPKPSLDAIHLLSPIRESWSELDERIRISNKEAEAIADDLPSAMICEFALHSKA
jgi:flagellar protein FliS